MKDHWTFKQVKTIIDLNLGDDGWCIAGGAAMELNGIRINTNDIDILCKAELYYKIEENKGKVWREGPSSELLTMTLVRRGSRPKIELLSVRNFQSYRPVTAAWIEDADLIQGLPVLRMDHLLEWKRLSCKDAGREKDLKDIKLLEVWLKK